MHLPVGRFRRALAASLVLTFPAACANGGDGNAGSSETRAPRTDPGEDAGGGATTMTRAPLREVRMSTVLTGLEAPGEITRTANGRVFVTKRDRGVLSEVGGGDVREVHRFPVDRSGEGGLLGLAASPDFDEDSTLFVFFTGATDNRIVRLTLTGAGDAEVTRIVTGIPKSAVHDGGCLAFGPDGLLYAGTGDAAVSSRAQDPSSPAGKVLRMTRDGGVPADNPTAGSLVYARGFRNVQGLAWDDRGRLFVTDFGPARDDEINLVEPGANHGWPAVTGMANRPESVDPIVVKQPAEASWSGLAFAGADAGNWAGSLLAASLRGQRLRRYALDAATGTVRGEEALFVGELGRLRQITPAPDRGFWLLTSNRDGRGSPGPDDRVLLVEPPG